MDAKHQVLKHYFGHSSFRNGQETVIDSLINGRDALSVMPTGAGKSVCYQVPALLLNGITLVVSPLISLMKDQVAALIQMGIPAAYINSSLEPNQVTKALEYASNGRYKIIYVAPERLHTWEFKRFCQRAKISLVAIDEAQKIMSCVIKTGQRYGKKMITDVLRGREAKRLLECGLEAQSTYGIMADYSKDEIYNIIDGLVWQGYMQNSAHQYSVLKVLPQSKAVLYGGEKVKIKLNRRLSSRLSDSINTIYNKKRKMCKIVADLQEKCDIFLLKCMELCDKLLLYINRRCGNGKINT